MPKVEGLSTGSLIASKYLAPFKESLKQAFPRLAQRYLKLRIAQHRKPWSELSVAETFTRIYLTKRWGGSPDEIFSSGHGSRNEFADRYAEVILKYIEDNDVTTVVDIGCGDFVIGKQIVLRSNISYVGVDIVPEVIEHHRREFGNERITFVCANAIEDQLPDADLCLIRQVLQHLSNDQVSSVLNNCSKYKHLITTEDVYVGPDARPNIDKPHGPDARWFEKSGIFVELPPFNLPARPILEMADGEHALLRTLAARTSSDQ